MPAEAAVSNFSQTTINLLDTIAASGDKYADKLAGYHGYGFRLSVILLFIGIAWALIESILGDNKNVIATCLKTAVVWAIAASFIVNWAPPGDSDGEALLFTTSVKGFFTGGMDKLTLEATGQTNKQTTEKVVTDFSNVIMSLVFNISSASEEEKKQQADANNQIKKVSFNSTVSGFFSFDMGDKIIGYLFRIISAVFVLWALVSFIFMLNMGQIMIYVGLVVGPIFVAFLVLKQTNFLFSSWIKFMISASLYQLIGIVIALLLIGSGPVGSPDAGVLSILSEYSIQSGNSNESSVFISMIILFYSILAKHIMDKTDNIATSLAGGGPNMGSSAIAAAVAGGAARIGGSAVQGALNKFNKGREKSDPKSAANKSAAASASTASALTNIASTMASSSAAPAALSAWTKMASARAKKGS